MKLHDFLVENAKFPFPHPDEDGSVDTTDVSQFELGMLEREWKAGHAVRDDTLVQNLCQTLRDILGDTLLADGAEKYLLASFSPQLQFDEDGIEDKGWEKNPSEVKSRSLLDVGFFQATRRFLAKFEPGSYYFSTALEQSVEGGSSKVDYIALVNDESKALVEAKSPSVMKKVGELLPPHGIELKWDRNQSLIPKILSKAALYLGLRKMEWLFLSCHNYWIVCRLVRDNNHIYLAYSPEISIKDSSEPFRAFLGAVLSVVKDVPVGRSAFSSNMKLDIINEDEDEGSLPEDDIDNDLGAYHGSADGKATTTYPATRSRAHDEHDSELIVRYVVFPEYYQVWVDLYSMSNNTLALPHRAEGKQRLWLTRFVGSGSTGNVWECRFGDSDNLFAVKVVEVLLPSDAGSRQRIHNEFNVYLTLEGAYQSGQLRNRIAPRCYGAFKGNCVDILILDLCEGILNQWGELSPPERSHVYKLVQDLHFIGIVHGDVEPRNIARTHGGGFCLIDFSESKRHICKEKKRTGNSSCPSPKSDLF